MKNVKSDTRYIIKRILIGVGIALILFNLKKCNVYALNSNNYYFYSTNSTTLNFSTSKPCTSSSNSCYHLVDSIEYDNSNINFYYYNTNNRYHNGFMYLFQYNNKYYIFATYYNATSYDYSNIAYLKMSINDTTLRYPPNIIAYSSNNDRIGNFATSDALNSPAPYYPFQHKFYEVDFDNVSIIENAESSYSYANKILSTGELLATNTDIPTYYGDRLLNPQDPLTNYTQLDLTGHQAVLLTPKNYQTMLSDSSHTIQPIPGTFNTYLDLDYYSQGCVQGSLIDINNTQDIITNNVGVGVGNLAETISGTCYEEPTQTILSYQFDMYSGFNSKGILIYNNSKNYDNNTNWINNQQTPYGQSYVWYNPTLYNYYFIDNFDTFTADITYTDFSGEEKTTHVESVPTFTDFMNSQKYQDTITDNPTTRQKISQLLSLIKLPFNFLFGIVNGTCEPLQAPIPHTNSNIILPCLSSQFESFLGQAPYNFFRLIINGLLCYRIIISLIIFTERNLDPSDARIEVLDL